MNPPIATAATGNSIPIILGNVAFWSTGVVGALKLVPQRLQYFKPWVVRSPQFGQYIGPSCVIAGRRILLVLTDSIPTAHVIIISFFERPRCIFGDAYKRLLSSGNSLRSRLDLTRLDLRPFQCDAIVLTNDPRKQSNEHRDDCEGDAGIEDKHCHHIALGKAQSREFLRDSERHQ